MLRLLLAVPRRQGSDPGAAEPRGHPERAGVGAGSGGHPG